jgi:hypothetical protein
VVNFTLLGGAANVCAADQFGGPFFSYAREDDDYESLCKRYVN